MVLVLLRFELLSIPEVLLVLPEIVLLNKLLLLVEVLLNPVPVLLLLKKLLDVLLELDELEPNKLFEELPVVLRGLLVWVVEKLTIAMSKLSYCLDSCYRGTSRTNFHL